MIKFLTRLFFSLILIFYLSIKTDWKLVLHSLNLVSFAHYLLSTCITLICPVILAAKYHLLIRDTHLTLSIPRLTVINYISRFYGLLIPTAIGPEAIRWYKVTKNKQGKSFFLASTIFERTFFLLILIFFGCIPLFLYSGNSQIILVRQKITPLLVSIFILLSLLLFYFTSRNVQLAMKQFAKKKIPINKTSKIFRFFKNFSLYHLSTSFILSILILSMVWQFCFLGRMFFLFSAMHLPFTFIEVSWMGSLVLLLQVLPISFAGIGVREGAYAYLFSLFSLPPEKGFLIGILFFTQMLLMALIGGFFEFFEK